jgi:hypothetical protein
MKFLLLLCLISCAHQIPSSQTSWGELWGRVHFSGAGKTRLEVPPQSWTASFESGFENNDWQMSLRIPTQGEVFFRFPALMNPVMGPIGPEDFRGEVMAALREASQQRKLNYPTLGLDFLQVVHHVMRWSYDKELGLDASCVEKKQHLFECRRDDIHSLWHWDSFKQEFVGTFALRGEYRIKIFFRNLTESVFKRATFEVSRSNSAIQDIELRQDIFFR